MHKSETEIANEWKEIQKAQGNMKYFQVLYDRYYVAIFRYLYRRTDQEATAHDLTAQTFLKAMDALANYKHMGLPYSAYLFRVAANELNSYYIDQKKNSTFSFEESYLETIIDTNEGSGEPEEALEWIKAGLKSLKEKELHLIQLRFYEGKTFKEMAYILDETESAIKMRMYRCLEKLKQQYMERERSTFQRLKQLFRS